MAVELERKPVSTTPVREERYLTFSLNGEEFGMEVRKVREIVRMKNINIIPETSSCEKLLMNIFGMEIPVVDMRLKLGFEGAAYTQNTCIVVVQAKNAFHGLVVDAVSEVISVKNDLLEPPPYFKDNANSDFFLGTVKIHNKPKHLLDIDKVIGMKETGKNLPRA